MINASTSKWLTGVAACGLTVIAVAAPFSVKYTDTVSASPPPPGIINGQQVTVEFILDNGNSSAASQTWSAANLKLVCFTFNNAQDKSVSIDYSGSPLTANGSTVVTTGNFTTNGSGQLQAGTIDWEDFRDPIPNPHVTNLAGVTTVGDWFIDHFNHVIRFDTGQLGFTNVVNDDTVTNWSNPVPSTGVCSGGSAIGATTTAVISSLSPSVVGQSLTFTATVTGTTPTGTVQFKDGATNLGAPVALSGGVAAISISSLTPGTHSITAVYGGDADDATSTSPAISQVVNVVASSATQPIPTLSEWLLVLLAAMVAGLGLVMRRRS